MPNKKEEKSQPSVSEKQLQKPEENMTSAGLSKNVSLELLDLMKRVNEDSVTPESVNAACNCASQIHKILRLNFDLQKSGF